MKLQVLSIICAAALMVGCNGKVENKVNKTKSDDIYTVLNSATPTTKTSLSDSTISKVTEIATDSIKNIQSKITSTKDEAIKIVEETKEAVTTAVNEKITDAKKVITDTIEEKKEAISSVVNENVNSAKEKVSSLISSVTPDIKISNVKGKAIYAKCQGCHGVNGDTKALGKSAKIAGQDTATLISSLKGYKEGSRNVNGMGSLMSGQVATLSNGDIKAVSKHINSLGK